MDSTYVKEMERVANEGRVIEKDGETFSSLSMKAVFYQPRPEALTVRSLTAIADYLAKNVDGLKKEELLLHVVDAETVTLSSVINGKDRKRDAFLAAKYDGTRFKFGEWQGAEQFIINVNSLFIPSTGRDEILSYVSKVSIEDSSDLIDSGTEQTAQVRVGLKGSLTEGKKAPSRVVLVPFRTFREVEQPEGEFLFRMRRTDNQGVQMALFEADGGAWKAVALDRIKEWLDIQKVGVAIIA